MEEELKQAKESDSEAHMRERIHAIKTLCELLLDEKPALPIVQSTSTVLQTHVSQPIVQTKKVDLGEQANGDSLFDF